MLDLDFHSGDEVHQGKLIIPPAGRPRGVVFGPSAWRRRWKASLAHRGAAPCANPASLMHRRHLDGRGAADLVAAFFSLFKILRGVLPFAD